MSKTLITSYYNPDLDGIACMYAYAELLKKQGQKNIEFGYTGKPINEVDFALEKANIGPKEIQNIENNIEDYSNYVFVDFSEIESLKEFANQINPSSVIEIIDHHPAEKRDTQNNIKIQNDKIGAAATIIVERFQESNIEISKNSGILLYLAIASNTLNFKAKSTNPRDIKAFKYLEKEFDLDRELILEMFKYKSKIANINKHFLQDTKIMNNGINYTQIEIVEANTFIEDNYNEIFGFLKYIKGKTNSEQNFISFVDLWEDKNIFITINPEIKTLLSNILDIDFEGDIATRKGLIQRKEVIPMILNYYKN